MKTIKLLGAFITILVISFGSVAWFSLSTLRAESNRRHKELLVEEMSLLENSLMLYIKQAKKVGQSQVDTFTREVEYTIGSDPQVLSDVYDSYSEPNNPIRSILVGILSGYYFDDVVGFDMDPFIVIGNFIGLDDSPDCASYGSYRSVFDEYTMHANPYLARMVFERIMKGDTDDILFFQFKSHSHGIDMQSVYKKQYGITIPEEHQNKLAQDLISYDMAGIREYFYRTESWEDTFESLEFIVNTQIYDKANVAGQLYIDNGVHTGVKRLSINTVFNFKTAVLGNNSLLRKDLSRFKMLRDHNKEQLIFVSNLVYIFTILLTIIMVICMNWLVTAMSQYDQGGQYECKE